MAKSAKDKLAVDGTPKLAAKSKPSDKHEKKNLSIEKATVESPRPSRKRAGNFFDFGDEADRVADSLAADGANTDNNAGVLKASKPIKKAKTSAAEPLDKKDEKKGKAGKDGPVEDKAVTEDEKRSKAKKAGKSDKDVPVDSSVDVTAVASDARGASNTTKKGQGKKMSEAPGSSAEVTKAPSKKANNTKKNVTESKQEKEQKTKVTKKTAGNEETIEDRVVAEDEKKQRATKKDNAKKDVISGRSGDTIATPEETFETTHKAKKGKTSEDVAAKTKADVSKVSKKGFLEASKKDKSESPKTLKTLEKDPANKKVPGKKAESKEKASKGKNVKDFKASVPKPSTKKPKAQASDDAVLESSKPALAGGAKDKGQTSVEGVKAPKMSKAKSDAKTPASVVEGSKPAKKSKNSEVVRPKKSATDTEAAKPKKTNKVKDNKPDIADQAIQPMDLVSEEAALSELSKSGPSKGKKRKAPSDAAADTLKSDILDPLSEHAADESAKKKQKKSRKSLSATLGEMVATGADAVRNSFTGILGGGGTDGKPTTTGSSQKQSNGKGKTTDAADPQPTANEDEEDEDEDALDDVTAALLAGFESDEDDVLPPADAGYQKDSKIPRFPNSAATSKKLKAVKTAESDKAGVVYIGRIPHGFYEHELRTYFSQFGHVNRLRLSRSVKTGRSKHYAFLEFQNEDVAKIVAQTMDNYLMFGHILKCKLVAPGDVHESMWKGANKRFKKVPWNKIEGRKLEIPASREVWKKREDKEVKKRAEKSKKTMETVGYAFEGTGLRSVDTVPKRIIAAATEHETSLVTTSGGDRPGPVTISEEIKEVKVKKRANVVTQSAKTVAQEGREGALDGSDMDLTSVTR